MDFQEQPAKNVDISSGERTQLQQFVAIQSNIHILYFIINSCKGQYTFIGKGCGIGLTGEKLTYKGAWEGF